MFLRGKIYCTDFYSQQGQRVRLSLHTSDPKLADTLEKAIKKFFNTHQFKEEETVLWSKFKKWFDRFLTDNRSPSTAYIHHLAIRYLEEYHKPRYLREITPDFLLLFKEWIGKRHKGPALRNRVIKAIKTMMKTAEAFKKIGVVQTWNKIKRDRSESDGRVVYHPLEELRQINAVLDGDLKTVFFLGWEEGLRRGEIAHLQKQDYNPEMHTITICAKPDWQPKTKRSARTVPLRPDTERYIRSSMANNPTSQYIINIPGNRNTAHYLSYHYRATCKKELPHLHTFLHKLRHTYGTFLIQRGNDLKTVCDLMGHTNVLQTEKYVHLGQSQYVAAANTLPSVGD